MCIFLGPRIGGAPTLPAIGGNLSPTSLSTSLTQAPCCEPVAAAATTYSANAC